MSLRTPISTLLFSASAAACRLVGVHRGTGVCKFSYGLGPSCNILGVTTIVIQIYSCFGCEGLFLQVVASLKGSLSDSYVGTDLLAQWLRHGFEPWSGKIPHAAEQLSPRVTATEPTCLEPVLPNKRSHRNEKPAHRNKNPTQPKIKINKFILKKKTKLLYGHPEAFPKHFRG